MSELYESKDEMVSHPGHYQSKTGIETIDLITVSCRDLYGIFAVDTANCIKYACRWKHKNGLQDIEKILWYATHLREMISKHGYIRDISPESFTNLTFVYDAINGFVADLNEKERALTCGMLKAACTWSDVTDIYILIQCATELVELLEGENHE